MRYLFIEQLAQAKKNQYSWHNFERRMSQYLSKQPDASELLHRSVNDLEAETTLCPCGKGLLVVTVEDGEKFWDPKIITPHLLCPRCQNQFKMNVRRLHPDLAIETDVEVQFCDADGVQFSLFPQTKTNWKILSWS